MDEGTPFADGRYRLVQSLGKGGMAEVWRAYDTQLRSPRALKLMKPELAARTSLRDRFMTEARAMASLRHDHVVAVHDVGEWRQQPYIVMELVDGGSLAEIAIKEGPIAAADVLGIAVAILSAVEAAHARGIIHRDIKPHNILLDADGTPKLADFGIAHDDRAEVGHTRTGSTMGTHGYMAPEQRRDASRVDARADVFSMAATMVAVLTGADPVDLEAREARAPLLSTLPPALAAVLDKALDYDPDRRYLTATLFREALEALPTDDLAGEGAAPATASDLHGALSARAPVALGTTMPASNSTQTATDSAAGGGVPGWLWLLAGLMVVGSGAGAVVWSRLRGPVSLAGPVVATPAPELAAPSGGPAVSPTTTPPAAAAPTSGAANSGTVPTASTSPAGPAGRLEIHTRPTATVTLDGKKVGKGSWAGAVGEGRHEVRLRTSDGRSLAESVLVFANETTNYCWDFDAMKSCSVHP